MKKQLLCTSAIALGVAAAPAAAQEWNLDWGGFLNTHVAVGDLSGNLTDPVDQDGDGVLDSVSLDGDGLDIVATGEIIFTPSVTLDNGLSFGVNVQFEAQNAAGGADGIDESYITISSDTFGTLDIGAENSAGYKLSVAAPSVSSLFINSPSISGFFGFSSVVPGNFRQAGISSYIEVAGNNDTQRITYYTPDFAGLTVGFSYAPTGATNAETGSFSTDTNLVLSDVFDVGANYSGSFGGVSLSLGARWGTGSAPDFVEGAPVAGADGILGSADDITPLVANAQSDPEAWAVGATVGFGGFSIGGAYAENDNGFAGGVGDQEGISLGATYDAPGPWAFGVEAYLGEYDGTGTGGADETYEVFQVVGSRDIGPGVNLDLTVTYAEADDEGTLGNDLEGIFLGASVNLAF